MSFDVLEGIREGEKNAKAQAAAKRKGAAAGRGSSGTRKSGKHAGARSAGRAAISKMKSRGRGCAVEIHRNGKSFKARIRYANGPGKNAELIYSNTDIRSMRACAKMRPDVKNPVGHISISLPKKAGKLTKEEWEKILETARAEYGLDETYPMQVWRHNDTPGRDHIHIVYSRISVLGKCHDDQNSKYRAATIERILEDHHKLVLVPPSEFKNTDSRLTKNEIEKGIRTHQKPARLQIKDALVIAIQGRPDIRQFVERLQASGVGVRANVSETTGKMSGFSFSFDGIEFKASDIGRQFGWQKLQQEINYDEATDRGYLITELDGGTGGASRHLAESIAVTDALNRAVEQVCTTTPDLPADIGHHPTPADPAIQIPNKATSRANTKTAQPAKPTAPTVLAGFSRDEILAPNLRSWAGAVHNRIGRFNRAAIQARALYDARNNLSAISSGTGFAIPEPKILNDAQIETILKQMSAGEPVQVSGNPDFCVMVDAIASKAGLKVVHEHQMSDAEKRAAKERYEARLREEKKSADLPAYTPK